MCVRVCILVHRSSLNVLHCISEKKTMRGSRMEWENYYIFTSLWSIGNIRIYYLFYSRVLHSLTLMFRSVKKYTVNANTWNDVSLVKRVPFVSSCFSIPHFWAYALESINRHWIFGGQEGKHIFSSLKLKTAISFHYESLSWRVGGGSRRDKLDFWGKKPYEFFMSIFAGGKRRFFTGFLTQLQTIDALSDTQAYTY